MSQHHNDAIRARARQTFKHHLEYLSSGRIPEWVNLFTKDGVLEFPYPPTGTPDYFKGHAALYDYMQHFPETFRLKFVNVRFHETADPALVIAEFNSEGIAISTGKSYNQTYISVVETRDGKISHYKDFWNPLIGMEALGSSTGIPTGAN